MNFKNYSTISRPIKAQINNVANIWRDTLGESLIGVYIHGSMALEAFDEAMSDIDILIICNRKISRDEKLCLAKKIIDADRQPCPLEMSAICIDDLKPWTHPTACQFHYSDYHTENYRKLLCGELNEYYIIDHEFEDSDIACHVKLTKQCGIKVCGANIDEVFPDVPECDFISSISAEIDDYDFNSYQPRYYASNILILGRILSYFKEKYILSKYEAGVWAVKYVPEEYKDIIQNALEVWYEQKPLREFSRESLEKLRIFLIGEIKKYL